jgi:nucleotidyltransferase/DNA polymerase involved in DNA repair
MRCNGRRRTQRPRDHGSESLIVRGAARAGLVKRTITAILQKSAAPLANGVFVEAEFGSYRLARQAIRTSQDRAASLR